MRFGKACKPLDSPPFSATIAFAKVARFLSSRLPWRESCRARRHLLFPFSVSRYIAVRFDFQINPRRRDTTYMCKYRYLHRNPFAAWRDVCVNSYCDEQQLGWDGELVSLHFTACKSRLRVSRVYFYLLYRLCFAHSYPSVSITDVTKVHGARE